MGIRGSAGPTGIRLSLRPENLPYRPVNNRSRDIAALPSCAADLNRRPSEAHGVCPPALGQGARAPEGGPWIAETGKRGSAVFSGRAVKRAGPWLAMLLVPWALAAPRVTDPARQTALDRYVALPDGTYGFERVRSLPTLVGQVHALRMRSQSWRHTHEVHRTVWEYWLLVAVPSEVRHSTALLFIGGGNNRSDPPSGMDGNLARLAVETRSVVAELRNVPNRPLIFHGDGRERVEDDLIACTWDQFLRTGDELWPARLPMTKAAVRAMDTVTAFCASAEGGRHTIDRFVVAGGSKRGWTTWTTAAVDDRVVAIVPIVIDVLNLQESMRHHYAAYGFWAPAVGDYVVHGIMNWMGSKELAALAAIEDPFSYRDRLDLPKLLINATGDQFFLPDSWRFYFDQLPGEKHLRYVPNADHSLRGTDAFDTLKAFYISVLENRPRPRFQWRFTEERIEVETIDTPQAVTFWQATNPESRDFRLDTFGTNWTARPLEARGTLYSAPLPEPARGWSAGLVELTYLGPGNVPFKLTTPVRVVPDRTLHEFVPRRPRGTPLDAVSR